MMRVVIIGAIFPRLICTRGVATRTVGSIRCLFVLVGVHCVDFYAGWADGVIVCGSTFPCLGTNLRLTGSIDV